MNTLGRYTLIRRLATGGMGEIYLAEAEGAANFKKRVAIKRILPHLATNEDFVSKFIDEAHLMVQLQHGNIMPVLELSETDGELYIVMEYLPGRDLKAVIRRLRADGRRIPVDLALWLIAEVCAGLDYAHRKVGPDGEPLHVVHRDVSPSNIVLGAGGEVKLVDFGIARARGGMHQSVSGTLQGKFVYMSPEQAEGERTDPRSDVFSAGLVLYELLCGVRPFEGESETETLRLVRSGEIVAPSRIRDDLTGDLDALVARALERDREGRYPTAAAFRHAITHHLAVSGSKADAGAFGTFLGALFPEGVEAPVAEDVPMSLDDALNMQLGALTPSIDAFGRTRTSSLPRPQPPPAVTHPSGQVIPSIVETMPEHAVPPRVGGRRRWVLLGLLTGVASAAGIVNWWPREGYIRPNVTPAVAFTLEVDNQVHDVDQPLQAGETYHVCASAPERKPHCRKWALIPGQNPIPFVLALTVPPRLDPVISPADAEAVIEVDGHVVAVPYIGEFFQESEKAHYVCVQASGFVRHCNEVHARQGKVAPRFELVAVAEVAPEPDAGPAPEPDAGPAKTRPAVRARYVRITSTPTAQVWRGLIRLGVTPLAPERVRSVATTYELRAARHRTRRVIVPPDHEGGLLHVELEALGTGLLTVRAKPDAATILLDGKPIGVGSVPSLEVPEGRHTLVAQWTDPATGKVRRGERTIDIVAGEPAKVTDLDLRGAEP